MEVLWFIEGLLLLNWFAEFDTVYRFVVLNRLIWSGYHAKAELYRRPTIYNYQLASLLWCSIYDVIDGRITYHWSAYWSNATPFCSRWNFRITCWLFPKKIHFYIVMLSYFYFYGRKRKVMSIFNKKCFCYHRWSQLFVEQMKCSIFQISH